MIYPLQFVPYFKLVIWGGNKILSFKGLQLSQTNIGESWEISSVPDFVSVVADGPYKGKTITELIDMFGAELIGEENYKKYGNKFPLLVKFIDAADNLSVQVHPGDELAKQRHNSSGKNEMWTVVDAARDSKIYAGLKAPITSDDYEQLVSDNKIIDAVAEYNALPGDVFYIPAGQIHALGAGSLVVEIQQTSDVTYRIYDYLRRDKDGNLRELHTELARQAIDFDSTTSCKVQPHGSLLIECPHFIVHRISEGGDIPHTRDSFTIVMSLNATACISYPGGELQLPQGHTCLFPATMKKLRVAPGSTIISVQA